MPVPTLIGAIDQGTTSTRFIAFNTEGKPIASHQIEFNQIYPHPGWIEHDPQEIVDSVIDCINHTARQLRTMDIPAFAIKAVGITNQRETTVVWDAETGIPICNAIVWGDTRTANTVATLSAKPGADKIREICGLPISTYFSAVKLRWLLDNNKDVKSSYDRGKLAFGTIDTWLLYQLSGGLNGGRHITDPTNACRTMLMDIRTLKWDKSLIEFFGLEKLILPEIVSSSEIYCRLGTGLLAGCPLAGCLGDQAAALVGQKAVTPGLAKSTYGTGCFILYNTGNDPVISKNGLLTTIGFQLKGQKPVYALEGSIAVAGSAIKWTRDKLEMIESSEQIGELAASVPDSAGVVFVTAFSGLFAPYWRDDARGTMFGITQYTTKAHIARATIEATCFQVKAILEAMHKDSGKPFEKLRVDGGMTNSDVCMQIQSDILGMEVERPAMRETTALGAAIAAGIAVGIWKGIDDLDKVNTEGTTVFTAKTTPEEREAMHKFWDKAVSRAVGWLEPDETK